MTRENANTMTTFLQMVLEDGDTYDTIFDLMEELSLGTGEDYYSIASCFVSAFKEIVFNVADILDREAEEAESILCNKLVHIR